jgi:hypothetical protein
VLPVRDSKEALRHEVDVLRDELAEKDAEIARLKGEPIEPPAPPEEPKPPKPSPPPAHDKGPVEIRIGRRRADGSVRYVVRPIEWVWVAIMAAVSIGIAWVAFSSGGHWAVLLIFPILPLGVAWNAGFDVNPAKQQIRAWQALGFIRFQSFTLPHANMPQVRSAIETHTNSDGHESRARVTRLYWGSRNLRVGLKREALDELLAEAKRVARA